MVCVVLWMMIWHFHDGWSTTLWFIIKQLRHCVFGVISLIFCFKVNPTFYDCFPHVIKKHSILLQYDIFHIVENPLADNISIQTAIKLKQYQMSYCSVFCIYWFQNGSMQRLWWWESLLVGAAMNRLLTQTQRVNIILMVTYGRSNTTHTWPVFNYISCQHKNPESGAAPSQKKSNRIGPKSRTEDPNLEPQTLNLKP